MSATISQIIDAIENLAPLSLQDDFDNAGLQVGMSDEPLTGILVCLDITEDVIDEAITLGCNLILSHHPLIFRPLKQISDSTYQQRCAVKALRNGITLYSAHTNLDNAENGVNYKMASMIGLSGLQWLEERPVTAGRKCGSGVIGTLPDAEDPEKFLSRLKNLFKVDCLMHSNLPAGGIKSVALCGGAGAFLIDEARAKGADCFITGEISYHHFFDAEGLLLVSLGHFQSEQYTQDLLRDFLSSQFPDIRIELTAKNTNPINYLI